MGNILRERVKGANDDGLMAATATSLTGHDYDNGGKKFGHTRYN